MAALAVGHALWSAGQEGWTYDEAFHLQWSERFLETGIGERASQERFNSKTPIMVPNVLARKAARAAGIDDPRALRFAARLPGALWLALLLGTLYAAVRRWVSPLAAGLATSAAALDPSLVAHASLATADVAFAFATLATLVAFLRLWHRPAAGAAVLAGAALGLAFVAKVSAVLLLPGLLLLPLALREDDGRAAVRGRRLLALGGAVAVAWAIVCGAYLFREVGRPLASLPPRSGPFALCARLLPGLRLPLPAALLTALDASLVSERRPWNVVALGRLYPDGVWYYFILMWALKTPLLLLAAEVLGLVRALRAPSARRSPLVRVCAWNAALILAYFSLAFHAQIGYRYVLMAVPLAYAVAAAVLATLPPRRPWTALAVLVALTALAENAAYLGNPLSFTSAAVEPKRLAYRLLADSNIDWGQNRERIAKWLADRDWTAAHVDPVHILPGRNVIDLNAVAGVGDFEQHRWLREHLRPRGHLGHTWLWYDVDGETFNRFLYDARRLVPDAFSTAACPASLDYERRPGDSETPFSVHRTPQPDQTWIACLLVRRDTDVGFRVTGGAIGIGTLRGPGACRVEAVSEGQEVWWRLEPGTQALCLVAQPNRRPWLPYDLEGAWLVRGWGVGFNLRPLGPAPTPPPPAATILRSSSPPRPRAG